MTARDIQTIIDEMITDIESRTDLYDATGMDPEKLTNPSNASIWYNLLGLFAAEAHILESEMETLENELESRKLEIPVGTPKWHADESKNFQYGDTLIVINGVPQYSTEDPLAKIVEVASATEQSGVVLIKAAKLDIDGNPEPLDALELSGFNQYWTKKRFAGTSISIISQPGDEMKIYGRIYVDGQKISDSGESQTDPGVYPVEDAIKDYFKNLDFNGKFRVLNLIDAIQEVDGVYNVVLTSCMVKAYTGSTYLNVMSASDQSYITVSGYLIEDSIDLLRDTLEYIIE